MNRRWAAMREGDVCMEEAGAARAAGGDVHA